MNLFNRLFAIVVFLALIAGAAAVIFFAWEIPNRSLSALRDAVQWLDDNDSDASKGVLTAVAGSIGLLSLILLIIELKPRPATEVRVSDLKIGDAVLSTASIGQRIEEAVTQVASVSDVKAYVRAKGKGVRLALDLHVDPEANIALVTDEAVDVANDVLANRVHVALSEPPRVRLHYRELRLRRRVPGETPAAVVRENVEPIPVLPSAPDAPSEPVLAAVGAGADADSIIETPPQRQDNA